MFSLCESSPFPPQGQIRSGSHPKASSSNQPNHHEHKAFMHSGTTFQPPLVKQDLVCLAYPGFGETSCLWGGNTFYKLLFFFFSCILPQLLVPGYKNDFYKFHSPCSSSHHLKTFSEKKFKIKEKDWRAFPSKNRNVLEVLLGIFTKWIYIASKNFLFKCGDKYT